MVLMFILQLKLNIYFNILLLLGIQIRYIYFHCINYRFGKPEKNLGKINDL